MSFKCLRCSIPLETDYQLIFDETGIELQLDKLLGEHFKIFVVKNVNTTQALCHECVNKLIELYDEQKYKEDKLVEQVELEDSNQPEFDLEIEEFPVQSETDDFEEVIEETSDNEELLGINEPEENADPFKDASNLGVLSVQDYLQNVIKSDLEQISFDQYSDCMICDKSLNSHEEVLMHVATFHGVESETYPCIFCQKLEYFNSIKSLSQHIVLKHYDLNSIKIYCMCPECDTRFSSFINYNKHSCFKQNISSSRLQKECDQCSKKFISNKRYRFHLQFHLTKQRPKACFICDVIFSDENEFFEHIMYAHENDDSFVCRKCDLVCTTKESYDNHIKLHKAVRSFHCKYCSKSYFYNQMLTNHIQQHHSNQQLNECKICKKTLTSRHLLTRHMQLMHQEEIENDVFVCLACGLVGASESDIKNHIEEDKCPGAELSNEYLKISYACEFCELAFNTVVNLKVHRTIHEDNEFKCWICDSQYSEYKKLKTHIRTHKYDPIQSTFPTTRHYVCNVDCCDQSYLTWPSLRTHKIRHTTKLTCDICTKTFTTESNLNSHLKSHENNEKYTCQFCSKLCISQMSLAVHVARKHNNNCKTCPTCNTTCNSEEALQEHILSRHVEKECEHCGKITKNKKNLELHIQMVHTKVKKFFCGICGKGYFLKCDLKTHERTVHEETNKFKCQYCKFSTSYEKSFKAHFLKHEKNKPFKCAECLREFTRKACYKLHILRHSDNKPFVCPIEDCGRSFVSKGILNSHIKNTHPECEGEVIKTSQRPAKLKKLTQNKEIASSSDVVVTKVYSNNEYLELDDGEGGVVMFDGGNVGEEVELEYLSEGEMEIHGLK